MTLTASTPTVNYGEIFTRRWVVDVLLDITGYTADRDLGSLHLLEPSCGSGAFLGPAVERLISSAQAQGRDLALLDDAVRAYDLQPEHVKTARRVCRDLLVAAGSPEDTATTLAKTWIRHQDFLLPGVDDLAADVAIGNPPYIRYDDLDASTAAEYRRAWTTMKGRGDIYVGFYERCLAMLKPGGRVGFICADRWMRNQYGVVLRDRVSSRYSVQHVWTMHDVDAFESAVSAYPAITVLANQPQGTAVVADTTAAFGESSAQALAKWARDESLTRRSFVSMRAVRLGIFPSDCPLSLECSSIYLSMNNRVVIRIMRCGNYLYIPNCNTGESAARCQIRRRRLLSAPYDQSSWIEDAVLRDRFHT